MEKCGDQDSAKLIHSTVASDTNPSAGQITSMTAVEDKPFHLPTELWEKVFALVDLDDVKAVRLAWRRWTNIAARFLFTPFMFRVDRKDIERFELVARHDVMLAGIENVRFEVGTMGIEFMSRRLGFTYRQEYNAARLPLPRARYTDEELELAKEKVTQEYAAWNMRWHEAKQDFTDLKTVKSILTKLTSLQRIEISCASTPLTSELLLEAWMYGSHQKHFKRTHKQFVTLLLSLKATSSQIKHLAHDQLPVTFFATKEPLLRNLASSLQHLVTLRLTINATNYPHPRCWSGLGIFLRSIPGLQKLRFGFAPFDTGTTNPGMWLSAEDDLAHWYVPIWKMLGEHTWKNLSSLRLDGLMVCEAGLGQLLIRHASTLRYLNLFNLALWSGSFEGLLSSLRSELRLKKFRLWGVARGFHTPYDGWRLQPLFDVDDEIWSTQLKTHAMHTNARMTEAWKRLNCLSPLDVSRRIDLFMTPGISWPWPLHASDALGALIRPPFFGGHHSEQCQQDCVLGIAQINQAWEEGLKQSLNGWADNDAPDTQGIGEEEIIEFFDEDGFDDEGYDRNGLDINGGHFMDVYEEWQGARDPISRYAAERIIRDSILFQISRYQ